MTYSTLKSEVRKLFVEMIGEDSERCYNAQMIRDWFNENYPEANEDLSVSANSAAFYEAVKKWCEQYKSKNLQFPNEDIPAFGWSIIEPTPKLHLMKCDFMWDEESDCLDFKQENDERCENELTPVATGYIHEGQAYFEVWQGEECLDGGLLLRYQAHLALDALCALANLPELKPNHFISWHCLAFHLKTTFNLIARCYCRVSINATAEYAEIQEYYAGKHVEAMELSIKSSGLIPEGLVFDASYSSSDNDNFFFKFIEATQIISHSVDLSFIDNFSSDFENLFEIEHDRLASKPIKIEKIDYDDDKLLDEIRASILPQW